MASEHVAQGVHPTTGSFLMDGKFRKLGVIGAKGVGKSSVIARFSEGSFEEDYYPTIQDSYLVSTTVDGTAFNVEILDTAGQDEYSSLGSQLAVGIHGYLIVFSVRDRETFDLVSHVNSNLLVTLGGPPGQAIPRVLVGNKTDVETERHVSREDALALAQELKMPYTECSALTGKGVSDIFHVLLRQVESIGDFGTKKQKKKCTIS